VSTKSFKDQLRVIELTPALYNPFVLGQAWTAKQVEIALESKEPRVRTAAILSPQATDFQIQNALADEDYEVRLTALSFVMTKPTLLVSSQLTNSQRRAAFRYLMGLRANI